MVGDIYGIVIDDTGLCWAHGNNSLLIGQNLTEAQNTPEWQGIKQVLEKAKKVKKGFWFEFDHDGLKKKVYVNTHFDSKAKKQFIIIAGYYPDINQDLVMKVADACSPKF